MNIFGFTSLCASTFLTSFFFLPCLVECPVSNPLKDAKAKPKLLPKGVPEHVPQKDFDEIVLMEPKRVSDKLLEKLPEREPSGKGEVEKKTLESRIPVTVLESMTKVEEIPMMVVLEKVCEKVPEKLPKTVPEKDALQRKLTEQERTPEELAAELPVKVEKVKPDMSSKKDTEKTSVEKLPSKVPDKKPKKALEAQPKQAVEALKEPTTGKMEAVSTSVSLVRSVHLQQLHN